MKLKGMWGFIEKLSFFQFMGAAIPLLLAKFPKELPLLENQYFLALIGLISLSGLGLLLSLVIRIKAKKNENFRNKYTCIE